MKDIVLQPSFYDSFECIGGKCKNTCCRGWKIAFSKEEFKNMRRKAKTEAFLKLYEDAFTIQKGERTPYLIKLDEKGNCKFLTEKGLCTIYAEIGAENMCSTCQNFPRTCVQYLDRYECVLTIGCEEVIRLLLKEKDGLLLEVKEKEIPKVLKSVRSVISSIRIENRPIFQYYNNIKMLLLGALQNREYTFGERMVLLGMALQKIDTMEKQNNVKEIPQYIEKFLKDMDNKENKKIYKNFFDGIEKKGKQRAVQTLLYYQGMSIISLNTIKDIKEKIEKRLKVNQKLSTVVDMAEKNIKPRFDVTYSKEEYEKAMESFEKYLKGKEYYIENTMLEGFLSVSYPFHIGASIWQNYCAMASIYSIFLFMWTCYLDENSTDEDFVYCTTMVARSLFHNTEHSKFLEEHLKEYESNTLAHMAMLVL